MKRGIYLSGIVIAVLLLLGVSSGWTQILYVYEPFSYTSGQAISGQNGGTGFSAAWTATDSAASQVGASSLTSGSLSVQGNDMVTFNKLDAGTTNSNNLSRALSTPLGGVGQDIWVSFLLDKTAGSYGGLVLGSGNVQVGSSNGNKGLFIGYSGSTYNAGSNGASAGISGGTVTVGSTQFIVANLNYTSASGGTLTLYLDATPGGTLGTALGSVSFTLNNFNQIGFATSGSGMMFDEIRIGSSYLAVSPVPEPSTVVLLLTGALLLTVCVKRRCKA